MPWCNRGGCLDDLPVLVVVVALLAGVRLDGVAVRELIAVVTVLRVEAEVLVILPVDVGGVPVQPPPEHVTPSVAPMALAPVWMQLPPLQETPAWFTKHPTTSPVHDAIAPDWSQPPASPVQKSNVWVIEPKTPRARTPSTLALRRGGQNSK